jgi:hypothetical protein
LYPCTLLPFDPVTKIDRLDRIIRFAPHRWVSIGVAALFAFALAVGYTVRAGSPLPHIHDEFSYLLAAEMFAHGHASMPSPVSPAHFETIHELVEPRYASKYPPAQGLALAVGLLVANDARVGVWLSFAVLAASLVWMLQGWASPRWSLLPVLWTSLLLAATNWTYTLWGGSVAAIGGALLYGALGRLGKTRTARVRDALVMATGLLILANSRPFEGLLVALPAAVYMLWWVIAGPAPVRDRWMRVVLPVVGILMLGAGAMLGYNRAVTGDPLRMPYAEYQSRTGGGPAFLWGSVRPLPPTARVTEQELWRTDVTRFEGLKEPRTYASTIFRRFRSTLGTFLPLFAAFPLLLLPWSLRNGRVATAAAGFVATFASIAVLSWFHIHYLAPLIGVLLLLYVRSLRVLRHVLARRWGGAGTLVTAAIVLAILVEGVQRFRTPPPNHQRWAASSHYTRRRVAMADSLERLGGKHAIFVRYVPTYTAGNEWVYNSYDLDGAPVIWANDLGDARNTEVLRTMGREGWLIVIDQTSDTKLQRLVPPTASALPTAPVR